MTPEPMGRKRVVDELLQPGPIRLTELLEPPPGLVRVAQLEAELVESRPGFADELTTHPGRVRGFLGKVERGRDVPDGAATTPIQEVGLAHVGAHDAGARQGRRVA